MLETGRLVEEIIRTRSTVACTRLVDKYKGRVYSFCYHLVRDEENAEEIAQDAFLKALDKLHTLHEPDKFFQWMMRLTYHMVIDYVRKKKIKHEDLSLASQVTSSNDPLLDLVDLDRKQIIQRVLDQLQPEDRTVVSLYYMDDLSVKHIEEITGLSQSNIKVKLYRSRSILKKQFQKISNLL